MNSDRLLAAAIALAFQLQGCAIVPVGAYTNERLTASSVLAPQAAFDISPRRTETGAPVKTQPRVLVLLALSGGGSRAAYFSARTMLALQNINDSGGRRVDVLNEVDLMSSVSGGSLAAAYYASSYDPGHKGPAGVRIWDETNVADVMGRDYLSRWIHNWFWPTNIVRFWFSDFDRTDIMAQTFADNLFDNRYTGRDLRMSDLNPARPNLVLNATIGSRTTAQDDLQRVKPFGGVFTFTAEDFRSKIGADIAQYEVARAVMASATFPAVFNYMTLRSFPAPGETRDDEPPSYLHVFDGGNSDNLGLVSLKRVLLGKHAAAIMKYERIVIILVDAFRPSAGVAPTLSDPRGVADYFVDTNFLDATDSLLERNREKTLRQFLLRDIASGSVEECIHENLPAHACTAGPAWKQPAAQELKRLLDEKLYFLHVGFDAVTQPAVRDKLNSIPTTFKFAEGEMDAINVGVADIFSGKNPEMQACLYLLADMFTGPHAVRPAIPGNRWCGGSGIQEVDNRMQSLRSRVR